MAIGVGLCALNENELSAAKMCKMQFWASVVDKVNIVDRVQTSVDGKESIFFSKMTKKEFYHDCIFWKYTFWYLVALDIKMFCLELQ